MKTPVNAFKKAIAEKRTQYGLWVSLMGPLNTEICAAAGFDWILLDAEHTPNDSMNVLQQSQVIAAYPGPVITRYEIEPAVGVKGSQIINLVRDLARALSVVSIRVVETIPGKSCMGLEIPNPSRQIVRLSEIVSSQVYADVGTPLALALGKDIAGNPVVADLGGWRLDMHRLVYDDFSLADFHDFIARDHRLFTGAAILPLVPFLDGVAEAALRPCADAFEHDEP